MAATLPVQASDSQWTLIRPKTDDIRFSEDGSTLALKVGVGSLWGERSSRAEWSRFPDPPSNIFLQQARPVARVSVVIDYTPAARGDQAGLLLFADERNYVKLVREGMSKNPCSVLFAVQVDGQPTVVAKQVVEGRPATRVQLTIVGNTIEASFCHIGDTEMTLLGSCPVPAAAAALAAGLVAHCDHDDVDQWATFSSFSLTVSEESQ